MYLLCAIPHNLKYCLVLNRQQLFVLFFLLFILRLSVPGKVVPSFDVPQQFSILRGVSTKVDFDCDTMISKMFSIYLVLCYLVSICLSCRLLVPSELLNGCVFDPMIVSVSHAGFSINRDNCNSAIAKHIFAEQPLVYYGRARSVGVENLKKKKRVINKIRTATKIENPILVSKK